MGTDINMFCEVKRNGKWEANTKEVFKDWKDNPIELPYIGRNYDLFAILADVRNGYGFAGCYTGERFNPISECKGLPSDVSDYVKENLFEGGYGESYYTLAELLDYDWQQQHKSYGVVEYDEYANSVAKGLQPKSWCGGVGGPNIRIIDETEFPLKRKYTKYKYYVKGYLPVETYADAVGCFYTETIPTLKTLIPDGGTAEDVRIVFNFDC